MSRSIIRMRRRGKANSEDVRGGIDATVGLTRCYVPTFRG